MGRMKELYIEMLEKEMDQMSTMEYLEMVYHTDLADSFQGFHDPNYPYNDMLI